MPGNFIDLISPDGQPYHGPEEFARWGLQNGYRLATDEDKAALANDAANRASMEDFTGQAATALGGAADFLTAGAFKPALKHFSPERAAVLELGEEVNPGAATLGAVAGGVASLGLTPLLKGANMAGQAALKTVGPGMLGRAAQLGAEGVALSLPKAATEVFTGDPDAAAETVLFGGVTGAALGGAFGVGESALAKMLSVSPRATGALKKGLASAGEDLEVEMGLKHLGFQKSTLGKFGYDRAKELYQFAKEKGLVKVFSSAKDDFDLVDSLRKQAGADIGAVFDTIDATGKRFINTQEMFDRMTKEVGAELREGLKGGKLFAGERTAYEKALADIQGAITTKSGDFKAVSFGKLQSIKGDLGDYAWKQFSEIRPGRELVAKLERIVDDTIEQSLVHAEKTVPGQTKLWKQAKSEYRNYKDLLTPLENKVNQTGNQFVRPSDLAGAMIGAGIGGAPGAFAGYVINAVRQTIGAPLAAKGMAFLNDGLAARSSRITKSVSSFLDGATERAVPASVGALATQADEIGNRRPAGAGEPAAIDHVSERLAELVSNQELTATKLAELTEDISHASPEVAAAMNDKMLKALQYLNTSAPRRTLPQDPFNPQEYTAPDSARAVFERKLKAATNAYSVLDDMNAGVLHPDSIAAVKEIYPKFYDDIRTEILTQSTQKPRKLSYQKRLQLRLLFGSDLDPTYRPETIQRLQQNFLRPDPNQQQTPPPGGGPKFTAGTQPTEAGRIGAK